MNLQSVPIADIRVDEGTQIRVDGTDEVVAGDYGLLLRAGVDLGPAVVFKDEEKVLWMADGHIRHRACQLIRQKHLMCDVRKGSRRDAILYAVSANSTHGLRRTNADKRLAVITLLDDPEWGKWTGRKIAEQCGVDEGLVRKIKKDRNSGQAGTADNPQTFTVDDLPADARAVYDSLPPEEQESLLETAQADEQQEKDDKTGHQRHLLGYHWAKLRELTKEDPAAVQKALDAAENALVSHHGEFDAE